MACRQKTLAAAHLFKLVYVALAPVPDNKAAARVSLCAGQLHHQCPYLVPLLLSVLVGAEVAPLLVQQQLGQSSLNIHSSTAASTSSSSSSSSTAVDKAQLLCHLCHCLLEDRLPADADADTGGVDLRGVPSTAQQQQQQQQQQ